MPTTTITQTGQVEMAAGDLTRLRLPHATLFAQRASRCKTLAPNHRFAGILKFCGALAAQQQSELQQFPLLPLPDAALLDHCQKYGMPPLSPAGWPPHPHWQELVHRLIRAAAPELPAKEQQALQRCPTTDPRWLDIQKSHLLRRNAQLIAPIVAPFVGAALQVQWSALATRLPPISLQRASEQPRCPLCGSYPLAASLQVSGPSKTIRSLHCSLCSASWHMEHANCSNCGITRELPPLIFSDHQPHVQAETCSKCLSYLKLIRIDQAPDADPVADDLASLDLDLQMQKQGYTKIGGNLILLPTQNE